MRTIGVAVPVPDPWGSELQGWRASFGDPLAGAVPTHVTLLPPTQVEDAAFDAVDAHLRAVAEGGSPFELHLKGTGTFRPVSPVVFVQLVLGADECERLEAAVRSGPLGRELAFPYHPHVTIAHHLREHVLDFASAALATFEARFPVTAFSLYEHGPDEVWRPEREYRLGASGDGRG